MTNPIDTNPPPFHWVTDQARAWRLVAAVWDHDGDLFDTVVTETMSDGLEAVEKLLAALSRNLVVRLRMTIGAEALDELIGAELQACDTESDSDGTSG
jgi:hypothetical protein